VEIVDEDGLVDDGVLVWFGGPRSPTGEDVAEVTLHGNPVLVERAVAAAVAAGARLARPGEFTRRALIHGKVDLPGAEAVLALSQARSARGADLVRQAATRLPAWMAEVRRSLGIAAAELEARLDQGHDELAYESDDRLIDRLRLLEAELRATASRWGSGRVWIHGAHVALVGPVNAGKSSLFNLLCGETRALVHERPGTTRDVIEAHVILDGLPVILLDTAGERETDDPIEEAGVALARERAAEADLLLVVCRARSSGPTADEERLLRRTEGWPRILVYNGIDEPGFAAPPPGAVCTSARTGEGLPALRAQIRQLLGVHEVAGPVATSARQHDVVHRAADFVASAQTSLSLAGPAVAAEDLVLALEALAELQGADPREDVLSALFERFCIGK
jgi:tRNA modification GTPase